MVIPMINVPPERGLLVGTGVVIMGSPRSGTSMVAGLFAAHGVFFGTVRAADENNPRGYFEHVLLRNELPKIASTPKNWPEAWWESLHQDGWDGKQCWGAKYCITRWPFLVQLRPSLIVLTERPADEIVMSRANLFPHKQRPPNYRVPEVCAEALAAFMPEAPCPVVTINTPRLIAGDQKEARRAFDALGLPFRKDIAREWIDPTLWKRWA